MNIKKLLKMLNSVNRSEILDSLYEIGGNHDLVINPSDVLIEKMVDLLNHTDADIREQVVSVLGIHYREKKIFTKLINMIDEDEKDQSVLIVIVNALGSIASKYPERKDIALRSLSRIVINEELDSNLRGSAYIEILRLEKNISINEYAAHSTNIDTINVNKNLINRYLVSEP